MTPQSWTRDNAHSLQGSMAHLLFVAAFPRFVSKKSSKKGPGTMLGHCLIPLLPLLSPGPPSDIAVSITVFSPLHVVSNSFLLLPTLGAFRTQPWDRSQRRYSSSICLQPSINGDILHRGKQKCTFLVFSFQCLPRADCNEICSNFQRKEDSSKKNHFYAFTALSRFKK